MKYWGILLAAAMALLCGLGPADAQFRVVSSCSGLSALYPSDPGATGGLPASMDPTGTLCTAASVTASVTGFTPNGNFATLTASGSSGSVALPTGATVAIQNSGTTTVSCTLGVGSATATTNEIQVAAPSTVFVAVGSNTYGACIDQSGSASNVVVLAGGAGLGTGFGGGGGGSSSSITNWGGGTLGSMANYGTSPGAVLVPGMNAYVTNTPTIVQGNAGSNAQAWWARVGDGTNGPAKVQAGNAAATTDVALTVADPNVLAAVNSPPTLGSASAGLSPKLLNALSTTVTSIKSSAAGQLYMLHCGNSGASVAFVQVFDVATAGGVTLGTTTPVMSFEIDAGISAGFAESLVGIQFVNGIQVAATTTATGSSAPATALNCNAAYK